MKQFTTKYTDKIKGTLSGFDRIVFRGTLLPFTYETGRRFYLYQQQLPFIHFGKHAQDITERIKKSSLDPIEAEGKTIQYLQSSRTSKEETAKQIAAQQKITEGTVCVLSVVEPCKTLEVVPNKSTQRLELISTFGKCLHLYHYWIHPVFGFMNARIQTWFPFNIQVCLNGRETLSRQMDNAGMAYQRVDNCFPWVEDFQKAQSLLHQQLEVDWSCLLDEVALRLNPLHKELFSDFCPQYYWSCFQSEWATDVVFEDNETLQNLYPRFIQHGLTTFQSRDVMRFLGKKIPVTNKLPARFGGEVSSDLKTRHEGMRLKHRCEQNSVKMYDKAATELGAVLRVETTVQNPAAFKALRSKQGGAVDDLAVLPLRKGLADLSLRAEASHACNERYLDAQASADTSQSLQELLGQITQPTLYKEKRVRALRPFEAEDTKLLEAVSRGEYLINGLRNRDLQGVFFTDAAMDEKEARRRSGFVTRKLRLLRAHGIIQKIAGTHRYEVTLEGRKILAALLTAKQTPVDQLLPKAE